MKKFMVVVKGEVLLRGTEPECWKYVRANRIISASVVPAPRAERVKG